MQFLCERMLTTRSDGSDGGLSTNNDETSPKFEETDLIAAENEVSLPVNARPPSFILQPRKVPNRGMSDKHCCHDPALIVDSFEKSLFDEDIVRGITDTTHPFGEKSPLAVTFDGQDSNLGRSCLNNTCFESLTCSPSKKQKTIDRLGIQHFSPDTSYSENSVDDSCDDAIATSLKLHGVLKGPTSAPVYDEAQIPLSPVPTFSDGNQSFRKDSGRIIPSTSPFTPQCRGMLQKLNISSPPPIVATLSPSEMSGPVLPDSKRSPTKLKFDTIESPAWRSYGPSSSASISGGTPNRISVASTSSSPFQPCVHPEQKRHMRHHSGSSFKALPPRLYSQSNTDGNFQLTGTFSSSSSYTTSPSPRLVPLTVLSRNGTPVKTPEFVGTAPSASAKLEVPILGGATNGKSLSLMSSPLMRSLDHDKELEDEENRIFENEQQMMKCNTSDKIISPNLGIRISRDIKKYHQSPALPKIKLTPRTRMKARETNGGDREQLFPALETYNICDPLDDVDDCVVLPIFSPNDSSVLLSQTQKNLDGSDKSHLIAAEDDDEFDFVSGFDKHSASTTNDGDTELFEDDAEIMKLANGSSSPAMPRLSSTIHTTYQSNFRRSDFSSSDGDNSFTSADHAKAARSEGLPPRAPVPSITLHSFDQSGAIPSWNKATVSRDSCLPRPIPMPQNKSRSLLHASSSDDPILRILHAEAVAEAARSNEPLTDDDSDADDSGFFLSSPQFNSVNGSHPKPRGNQSLGQKSDVHDFNAITETNGNKARVGPMPVGPATAQLSQLHTSPLVTDCLNTAQVRKNFSLQSKPGFSFAPVPMSSCFRALSDATSSSMYSFSDCDSIDDMFSPKHHRKKPFVSFDDSNESHNNQSRGRESVNSILSMSSLHGLDIVNETNQLSSKIPLMPRDAVASATHMKPMRSELSLNSLGLSVDSYSDLGMADRNLSTPDLITSGHNRTALSPPPLQPPAPRF